MNRFSNTAYLCVFAGLLSVQTLDARTAMNSAPPPASNANIAAGTYSDPAGYDFAADAIIPNLTVVTLQVPNPTVNPILLSEFSLTIDSGGELQVVFSEGIGFSLGSTLPAVLQLSNDGRLFVNNNSDTGLRIGNNNSLTNTGVTDIGNNATGFFPTTNSATGIAVSSTGGVFNNDDGTLNIGNQAGLNGTIGVSNPGAFNNINTGSVDINLGGDGSDTAIGFQNNGMGTYTSNTGASTLIRGGKELAGVSKTTGFFNGANATVELQDGSGQLRIEISEGVGFENAGTVNARESIRLEHTGGIGAVNRGTFNAILEAGSPSGSIVVLTGNNNNLFENRNGGVMTITVEDRPDAAGTGRGLRISQGEVDNQAGATINIINNEDGLTDRIGFFNQAGGVFTNDGLTSIDVANSGILGLSNAGMLNAKGTFNLMGGAGSIGLRNTGTMNVDVESGAGGSRVTVGEMSTLDNQATLDLDVVSGADSSTIGLDIGSNATLLNSGMYDSTLAESGVEGLKNRGTVTASGTFLLNDVPGSTGIRNTSSGTFNLDVQAGDTGNRIDLTGASLLRNQGTVDIDMAVDGGTSPQAIRVDSNATLTNESGATIDAEVNSVTHTVLRNEGTVNNNGVIDVDVVAGIALLNDGDFILNGRLLSLTGGYAGNAVENNGLLDVNLDNSQVLSRLRSQTGVINNSGGVIDVDVTGNTFNRIEDAISIEGSNASLTNASGGFIHLNNEYWIDNERVALDLRNAAELINAGQITINSRGTAIFLDDTLGSRIENQAGGVITIEDSVLEDRTLIRIGRQFENAGTLQLFEPDHTNIELLNANASFSSTGRIEGNGIAAGNNVGTFESTGAVAPGDPLVNNGIGELRFDTSTFLQEGGSIEVGIKGLAGGAGIDFDLLTVDELDLGLDGAELISIEVALQLGFVPQLGDVFPFLRYDSLAVGSGLLEVMEIDATSAPLAGGWVWDLNYDASSKEFQLVVTPEPSTYLLFGMLLPVVQAYRRRVGVKAKVRG